ncbi:MAG: hypothetical protein DHS20C17_06150 [Cyclobacteriaceae bacterium]|nr:MAG: hypothetical protein DHS20C17_06150 [Cyclobacteriaceae bacterium]
MSGHYFTLASHAQGLYKEKGSKFLGFAYPVKNTLQVEQRLTRLVKLHHKARHHCYAYVLGNLGDDFRSNDAGEPKHSAGDPILGQIRSFGLTYVLVVVVRYFGGTKLGISGLVNAYRETARQTLSASSIIKKEPFEIWLLTFGYPDTNEVMRLVKELDLIVVEQNFLEQCSIKLQVPESKQTQIQGRLDSILNVVVEIL